MTDNEREARTRFAANIERLRQRNGLSMEELSLRSMTDKREIQEILCGDREADYGTISLLAGALEVEPGELFRGIAWIPPGKSGCGRYAIEEPEGE